MAAATVDMTAPVAGSTFQSWEASGVTRLVKALNFAEAVTAKGSALSASDTVDAMLIPAGSAVIAVFTRQLVAGTASSTYSVGSVASASLYIASVSNDAAAQTVGASSVSSNFFSTANAVRLTLGDTPPQTGKVEVTALVVPLSTSLTK